MPPAGFKLLILVTDLELGGTPMVVHRIALGLREMGFDVQVACLAPMGLVGQRIASAGIPVHALGAKGAWDVRVIFRLMRLMKAESYSAVLSFLVHANVCASLTVPLDTKLIQCIQTTQPYPWWHWKAQRWAANTRLTKEPIVVPSESVQEFAIFFSDILSSRISIIPNGIDLADWPEMIDKQLMGNESRVIGFLGRLDPIKRVDLLISAMAKLPDHRCVIVGDGPERKKLEQLAKKLNVESRVSFLGNLSSAKEAFKHMDLLVLPSKAEGFPMVLLEAMAAGVPIVASDSPGIFDVVQDLYTARLFEQGDAVDLAAKLNEVLSNPTAATSRAQAARLRVVQKYQWQNILPKYAKLLTAD